MPKIVIREYDATSAGVGLYTNFSVVVPGYVGVGDDTTAAATAFDENGVCELTSQKEFTDKIGYKEAITQVTTTARAATPRLDNGNFYTFTTNATITAEGAVVGAVVAANDELDATATYYIRVESQSGAGYLNDGTYAYTAATPVKVYPADTYYKLINDGQDAGESAAVAAEAVVLAPDGELEDNVTYYTRAASSAGAGYLNDGEYSYTEATPVNAYPVDTYFVLTSLGRNEERGLQYFIEHLGDGLNLYEAFATTGKVGRLKSVIGTTTYRYELVDTEDTASSVANRNFVIIGNTDEELGQNESKGNLQIGNQIAYELLGLGYTVLYKKLTEGSTVSDWNAFFAPLKDKSLYDFRYIITGFSDDNKDINNAIIALANFINKNAETLDDNGRGDCVALCDIPSGAFEGSSQKNAITHIKREVSLLTKSKYAAFFAPTVEYSNIPSAKTYGNSTFPASFHYLACAAKAAEYYNEWYAIAGYTRGVCTFDIADVGCKFGEEAANSLAPRYITKYTDPEDGSQKEFQAAVNLIVKIKSGYYLWGNRTAEKLGTKDSDDGDLKASHFLNIRQLCSTIKKQVYITCKKYTFDPNSDVLWINFCEDIRPLLEKMKADQGITDYKFVKVKTKQKAILKAKIRIVPIEAVEDFDISLTLEDSIAGTVVDVAE